MIKNIVFDLGNVILYDTPISVLDNIQISDNDRKIIEETFFKNFKELDLGNITLEEHLNNCNIDYILNDELKDYLLNYYKYRNFNNDILDLMLSLKNNNYNIYILSNNNKETTEYLKSLDIFKCISGWTISCDIHSVKPDEEIYLKLFEKFNLNPKECFFIDDSKKNIDAGRKLGMNGHILNYREEKLEKLINNMKEVGIDI